MTPHASAATSPVDTVPVKLGGRSYDIRIGRGLLATVGMHIVPHLARPLVAIVTDETVADLHLRALVLSLDDAGIAAKTIILPPGEKTKSFAALEHLCGALLDGGLERNDRIIALGGGVIGDLTGFASAIVRRGMGFIQIPTTLLAQVDSSVGGKTGINMAQGKNLVGAFHQPVAVIADTGLLDTLPPREFSAGYAEVVKYALLGDADFYGWLDSNLDVLLTGDDAARAHAIRTSCEAKARIVAEDETETGVRALLNLGHTFGHALEAATGYGPRLLHGEAVAIGMAQAFRFSAAQGLCSQESARAVEHHLTQARLPIYPSQIEGDLPPPQALVKIMGQDKKSVAGSLTFILVRGIGSAFIARNVDASAVERFLEADLACTPRTA